MLGKPDMETYAALHRLSVDSDGRALLDWLVKEQVALEKANRFEKEAPLFHQRQGALQCITGILDRASEAKLVVQKLRSA